ncbi:MAG: glycosyltransferase family 2 protein [Defluviitaleaceae bacterium]|nr:glycosyltransferase family 2 protein [Defluviitaleaceae bacterium]
MIKISLCMIVKNEEKTLSRCLNSIKNVVDEIIIVDTGSTDNTIEIAQKFTENIYNFKWCHDFSIARNFAFSKANCEYQMWLDADDIFPEKYIEEMINLKKFINKETDIVTMKYITDFDEKENPNLIVTRERIFKKEKNYKWIDPVHELIPLEGNIFHSDIYIHHKKEKIDIKSRRNIEIYENIEKQRISFTLRQMYYYARELQNHEEWIKSAYYFEKFINSNLGWYEDIIMAIFNLSMIYEILNEKEKILEVLIKSFMWDSPRAEICCRIGHYFKDIINDYNTAIKWFKLATKVEDKDILSFKLIDYYGYIPNIEICVCYYKLGDIEKAKEYNEKAASFKITEEIEQNRKILNKIS